MSESKSTWLTKHKNKLFAFFICIAIILICLSVLVRHYRQPAFSEDLISMMENKALDIRFLWRGKTKPSGKVGILAIDEKSLQRFGRWPIARKDYEPAFKNLKKMGADWVGFDVVWSEPERPLLQDIKVNVDEMKNAKPSNLGTVVKDQLQQIETAMAASIGDQSVATMIREYEKIVLGYFYYASKSEAQALGTSPFKGLDLMLDSAIQAIVLPDGREVKDYYGLKAHGVVGNTPFISAAGQNFAFFNNESDSDAIMRWVTLVKEMDGNLMPALSLKLASKVLNREIVTFFDNSGITEISMVNPDDDQDILKIPVDHHGRGRILINHYGPDKTLSHFSLADVFDDKLSSKDKAKLKGMSLILGPTAIAINDQRANPFDAGVNGVENHAAVVDNIVSGNFMRRTEKIFLTEMLVVIGVGVFFAPIMVFGKAVFSGIAALLFIVGYYYFDKFFWFQKGEWVYIGMPFIEIASLYISTTLYKYVTEERDKKKIKGALGLYLSPDIANEVAQDPDALKLGGVRKELTVFFSDVRGFTTISEGLSAEQLGKLMNDYFTPMAELIQQSRGTLDKYIGDAIMAFWGAPASLPNHADAATHTCIKMLFALDRIKADFKARQLPPVDIGIGLNTGFMSVGNFGSPQRFCYTVMGDSVNLGARLEGATKEYGIKIMISEFTRKALTDPAFFIRDLDDIRVKGKLKPVNVFDVMRPDILPNENQIRNLIGEFELGRAAYKQQDWKKANKHFLACLTLKPDDGPSDLYLRRIEELSSQPQVPDWDGVYVFTHK